MRNMTAFPKLAYMQPPDDLVVGMQYLGKEGLELVNDLIDWYAYYDAKQWTDSNGKEIDPSKLKTDNKLDYTPTMLTINLVAWFIDKLASFMFERPIDFSCKAEQIDEATLIEDPNYQKSSEQMSAEVKASARERLCYRLKKQNLLDEKLLKAATDSIIGTAVCVKLHYDEKLGLRIIWRPRLEFWPIYNADDIDILEKIHFTAYVDDETIWKQTYWMNDDGLCWMEEGYYNTNDLKLKEQIVAAAPLKGNLPFMPIEIITRGGLTGETKGRSLVPVLKGLNDEVNKKVSDNADSLRFGMFAIKVLINALQDKNNPLKTAPNALWELFGEEGVQVDAKLLESNFQYRETLKEHLENLLEMMHRLAEVPNVSQDKVTGIGQLSGFALKLLYGPIISATNKSMMIWEPRLQRLFGKALYMLNKYEASKHYDKDLLANAALEEIDMTNLEDIVDIKTYVPLPENEAEIVDAEAKKVGLGLQSTKGALDNMGEENPEMKHAEIRSEKMRTMEQENKMMQKYQPKV